MSVSASVLWVTAGAVLAQPSTLSREHDPVVLEGASLPTLAGGPVGAIVAFRYEEGAGGWQQIPVQVDERKLVDFGVVYNLAPIGITTMAYADATTYTGPDPDPGFDADDELVFMSGDVGGRATGLPGGVLPETGLEVAVTDPIDGGIGWAYLFLTDGTLWPDAGRDDVTYTFDLLAGTYIPDYNTLTGPNPEDSTAVTDHYRVHFSDRWIRDEMNVYAGGAGGDDILDRHKNLFAPGNCTRTEDTFSAGEGAFVTNRDGPIRGIRSYLGANSGPLTQREHLFYARREDVSTFLRVHAISGVMDLFDYSPAATGMVYFNDLNLSGVDVDGVPDVVTPGALTWEMVTGLQGTLIMPGTVVTDIPGFAYTSYYSDDRRTPVTQCTGDAFEYATSGLWVDQPIPNTDPNLGAAYIMTARRTVYYDAPDQTTDLAALRAQQALHPLGAAAEPYAPCPWDCGDGDGAVSVVDFLALLAQWGTPGPCDVDGGGVGVTDFLQMLAHWGACP
jgi:hypothetical protein